MSRAYSTLVKRVMLVSFLAVLLCAAPALATTWSITDANLVGGGSVSGEFTYVPTSVTTWAITITIPAVDVPTGAQSSFTLSGANVTAAIQGGGSSTDILFLSGNEHGTAWTGLPEYDVQLTYDQGWNALAGNVSIPLEIGSATFAQVTGTDGYHIAGLTSGAQLDPVPLPPSALLLVTGLIPLAWASRRKLLR